MQRLWSSTSVGEDRFYYNAHADRIYILLGTEATVQGGAKYDESTKKWTTTVVRAGQQPREMKVAHIIMATGFSGEARMPSWPGMDTFKGPMPHSSKHIGAAGWEGKKAVVVGCCNSGHDIA